MKLPLFDYARPQSLAEAVALLAAHQGDAKALAGGQSLIPMLAFRIAAPSLIVDLGKVAELKRISIDEDGVTLGAMVRYRDILDDAALRAAQPLLVEAVGHVAHYQIRNRGTVGGSLAHADPAAELPCIALTCAAEIKAIGVNGARTIAAADFFRGPLTTALEPDEIISAVHLPPWPAGRRFGFAEFARRQGDFAVAAAALFYDRAADGTARNVHVGVIGGADRPLRLRPVEAAIEGRVIDAATIVAAVAATRAAVDPGDDIHASGAYRRVLLGVMVERALQSSL